MRCTYCGNEIPVAIQECRTCGQPGESLIGASFGEQEGIRLHVVGGQKDWPEGEESKDGCLIGTGPASDLRLKDGADGTDGTSIGLSQAYIRKNSEGQWCLYDLSDGRNPTCHGVRSEEILPMTGVKRLAPGDIIRIGNCEILVRTALPRVFQGEKPYVFISYCWDDRASVYPILKEMQTMGCRLWYDRGLLEANLQEEIRRKIDGAKVFVGFVSEKYLGRPSPRRECCLAWKKETEPQNFLIPVNLGRLSATRLQEIGNEPVEGMTPGEEAVWAAFLKALKKGFRWEEYQDPRGTAVSLMNRIKNMKRQVTYSVTS